MTKYLYTTVYEQFTGTKPPEPQEEDKPRRRRGYGHPYRMRLNMQEERRDPNQEVEKQNEEQASRNQSRCRNPYRLRKNKPAHNSDSDSQFNNEAFNPQYSMDEQQNSGLCAAQYGIKPQPKSSGNNSSQREFNGKSNRRHNHSFNNARANSRHQGGEYNGGTAKAAPKVVYKKRRHITQDAIENEQAATA